ncbi:MAG: amidohydrolase [Proteobacteria bacterium]|nr:amidohydrolase [Pseudomonadota bacterium]
MDGKVALEEHFAIDATLGEPNAFAPVWPELSRRLLNIDASLADMDEHGVAMMVMSLNAPAVQAIPDAATAIAVARRANDALADAIVMRSDRFAGFAALPMQDPDAAALELTRCVKELGFVGALVNGFSQIGNVDNATYYDGPAYRAFWATVERLDVPFYLHPRNPLPGHAPQYQDHAWMLGPNWAFAAETAVHALRLIGSGLFDAHPRLKIILGHLGEGIPALLWRIDNRNGWMKLPHRYTAKHSVAPYFHRNFYLTTAGNFHTPALDNCLAEVGDDHLLFSIDWPFEDIGQACRWLEGAPLDDARRAKIARENAIKLLKLKI